MTTFKDLGLNPMILQALEEIGFETPTPIQTKAIPHLMSSTRDLIAMAQTGTGKTAAFSLPIIQQLDRGNQVQALILCPTRELAIQIANDIKNFMKYLPGFEVMAIFGGERMDKQISGMRRNPQIVVGTPGRVNDFINRKILKIDAIRWLVLDEADEMLNMGFKEELDEILKTTPADKQVLLFSATMNPPIRRIADNYMNKPEDITAGDKNKGSDNVEHFYYVVHEKDRYQALRRIADMNPDIHGIVFCRTRHETQDIADKLIQDHYSAEAIHGDISQEQRIHVMNRFRDKKVQLLIATDVAARGIDVNGLTHIINYNLPDKSESYVHRSGRTGRASNIGISLVIVNMREQYRIRDLERKIGKTFEKGFVPSGKDICERQLFSLIDKICNVEVNEDQINGYLAAISKKLEHLDRDELVKKFVSMEFNRFLEHYKGAVDLNSQEKSDRRQNSSVSSMLFAKFKINVGKSSGLNVKDLLVFLNSQPGLRGVEIGNVDLQSDSSFFEIDQRVKDKTLESLSRSTLNGVKVQAICEKTDLPSSRSFSSRSFSRGRSGGGGRGNGGGERRDSGSNGRRPSSGGSRGGNYDNSGSRNNRSGGRNRY